jgi:tRNA modification GTPase
VVEIQGHGGRVAARRILNTVLSAGARPADPGEFTRRAFLNGRIDLLQAEAVADLIRARSDRAAAAAIEQLEGGLSDLAGSIYDDTANVAADLAATLDFNEDELPGAVLDGLAARIRAAAARLKEMLATWEEGHLLREGAKIVLAGQPNVGKSSLMNCLLGKDRAIVTATPGTTRDTIEESMVLDGVVLRLVDTAGLRDAAGDAERQGVARARESMQGADLTVYVLDGSAPLAQADNEALGHLDPDRSLVVINKTDLGERLAEQSLRHRHVVRCSCLLPEGIEPVRSALRDRFALDSSVPPHAVISERHLQNVQNALNALNEARKLLETRDESNQVLAATEIRAALEALGTMIGRTYTAELLETVFSRFCIGK